MSFLTCSVLAIAMTIPVSTLENHVKNAEKPKCRKFQSFNLVAVVISLQH